MLSEPHDVFNVDEFGSDKFLVFEDYIYRRNKMNKSYLTILACA